MSSTSCSLRGFCTPLPDLLVLGSHSLEGKTLGSSSEPSTHLTLGLSGAGAHAGRPTTNADAVADWYLKVAGKDFTRL